MTQNKTLTDRLYKQLDILSSHKDFNESCTIIDLIDAINTITELQSHINQLRDDLLNYGEHTDLCNIKEPTVAVCNCGLEKALSLTKGEY